MQKRFSTYLFSIVVLLHIVSYGVSYANEFSQSSEIHSFAFLASVGQNITETGSALSEFEGRYKVGNTFCRVVPVKMAFEVKWLKGRGVMHFFFDQTTPEGKSIFASKDFGKGRDEFIFNDNLYNTGIFKRADGKVFKLERLKAMPLS